MTSKVREPGIVDGPTIDGVPTSLARDVDIRDTLRQTIEATMSGASNLDIPYDGDGLPNQPDLYEAVLDYDLDESSSTFVDTLEFLEILRTAGGIHDVCFWKKRRYRYTARAGQTVFYLRSPDAFSKAYAGHNVQADDGAQITVTPPAAGGQPTIVYKASVLAGDAVAANEVWISNTAINHPRSGRKVALFKFGANVAPPPGAFVDVEFHPLLRMFVQGVPTKPFAIVGREDRTLMLTEGNK